MRQGLTEWITENPVPPSIGSDDDLMALADAVQGEVRLRLVPDPEWRAETRREIVAEARRGGYVRGAER